MGARAFGLGIAVIIISLFLLVNADAAFGAHADTARSLLTIYLILGNTMLILTPRRPDILTADVSRLILFLVGFFASAIFFVFLPQFFLASFSTIAVAVSFGFLYGFVVAFYEELIFRDLLPRGLGMTDFMASAVFALFHLAALAAVFGFNLLQLSIAFFVLFSLGMLWSFIRDRVGLMASVGSHVAWNLGVYAPSLLGMIVIFKPA